MSKKDIIYAFLFLVSLIVFRLAVDGFPVDLSTCLRLLCLDNLF